jgi:hypothetical protein
MACAKNRAGHFFREEALGLAALFTATSEFSQKLKRQLLSSHHPSELFFPSVKRLAYPCVILVPPSIHRIPSGSIRHLHEVPMSSQATTLIPAPVRLDSWKVIAQYLGRGTRTVQRWHVEYGLPVRHIGGISTSVFAFSDELDDWLQHH